ncbi:MAG: response regulator transcription factor [Desulfobacterales bacterium]
MKRILIVDDAKPVRERLISLLSEYPDIQIVGEAGNGKEALHALYHQKPDTVILDIRLPDKSGIEVLREIKAANPGISVIMITNYDFDQYRRQSLQLGADHFFNKTLELEEVVDLLNQPPAVEAEGLGSRIQKSEGPSECDHSNCSLNPWPLDPSEPGGKSSPEE